MLEDCCFKYSNIVKNNWENTAYILYQPTLSNYYNERINIEIKSEAFELKDYKFKVYTVLELSCKTEISIKNCVFEEGLGIFIGMDDSIEGISISIFRTESKKIIIGPHRKYDNISIDSCLIDDLNLGGELIDVIDIYKCEILDLYFESSIINKIKITGSFVKLLKYHFATFENVYIDRSSVTAHHNGRLNIPLKLFVQKITKETISEIEMLDKQLKNPVPPDNICKKNLFRFSNPIKKFVKTL